MTPPVVPPALEVCDLRKVFQIRGATGRVEREFVAVEQASFSVAPGESLGIVGESGSGKTTIARMLVGLQPPTSGTIVVGGHDRSAPARRASERRRRGRQWHVRRPGQPREQHDD